jgi:hypothetical protein
VSMPRRDPSPARSDKWRERDRERLEKLENARKRITQMGAPCPGCDGSITHAQGHSGHVFVVDSRAVQRGPLIVQLGDRDEPRIHIRGKSRDPWGFDPHKCPGGA